jgi:hypothetical protein
MSVIQKLNLPLKSLRQKLNCLITDSDYKQTRRIRVISIRLAFWIEIFLKSQAVKPICHKLVVLSNDKTLPLRNNIECIGLDDDLLVHFLLGKMKEARKTSFSQ